MAAIDITGMIAEALVDVIRKAEVNGLRAPESWPIIMRKADVKRCCNVSSSTVERWWKKLPTQDNGAWVGRDALYRWLNKV